MAEDNLGAAAHSGLDITDLGTPVQGLSRPVHPSAGGTQPPNARSSSIATAIAVAVAVAVDPGRHLDAERQAVRSQPEWLGHRRYGQTRVPTEETNRSSSA